MSARTARAPKVSAAQDERQRTKDHRDSLEASPRLGRWSFVLSPKQLRLLQTQQIGHQIVELTRREVVEGGGHEIGLEAGRNKIVRVSNGLDEILARAVARSAGRRHRPDIGHGRANDGAAQARRGVAGVTG